VGFKEGCLKDCRGVGKAGWHKGQDSDEEQFSWPESKREETEVQRSKEKGKQRE